MIEIAKPVNSGAAGSTTTTLSGPGSGPARFPVSYAGEKILDSITRAGGPKGQGYDTWVMLERNGKRATVPFGATATANARCPGMDN